MMKLPWLPRFARSAPEPEPEYPAYTPYPPYPEDPAQAGYLEELPEGPWEEPEEGYAPEGYDPPEYEAPEGYYPPEGYYAPEAYPPEEYPEDVSPEPGPWGEEIPSMDGDEDFPPEAAGPEAEPEVPIEEFSLEEMAEEEPPEALDAAPEEAGQEAETPSPIPAPDRYGEYPETEPAEEDPRRRPRLLSKRGRLRHPGWAETDEYEYNKERLRRPSRRKEWELYQLHNDRFALRICYGHTGYMSLVEVCFTDFATGESCRFGKRQFFPGDSLDLDFSGGQPHSLKYEDEELFLSLSFDGELRRIQLRSKELEAELSAHDAGDAIVTAVPFDAAGQFAYNYKKVFRDLFGHVTLRNQEQTLDTDTFLTLWSGRGLWPWRWSLLWGAGAQETEEGVLALNLGAGYGREDAPTENAVFVDGKLIKMGEVYFRFSSEDGKKPWRIVDRERRLKLSFRPENEELTERNWLLLHTRSQRLYGRLSGKLELPDGTKREIRDMPFFCEYGVYRW